MTRPSEITRETHEAAERLFAERGYDGTSIRAIVAKARVNQAAVNYHFAGKDGLYREVLLAAFRALTQHQVAHAGEPRRCHAKRRWRSSWPAVAALERARRTQPSSADFQLETARPTAVFRKLMSEEAAPFMGLAVDLVRRFQPTADQGTLMIAAVWLIGQCNVFVRNHEQLAAPPIGLLLDQTAVERLTALICGWAVGGLAVPA